MEEILYKSFVTSCNGNSDDPIDHIKCQLDRIHESVARGCYQTVLAGTMPLAFATQIGRLTRRVYLPCRSSNVERTCDDFNTSSLLVRAHDPRIVSTCFLLSNEINSALENSPSNALYDYAKNILVAGIGTSTKFIVDAWISAYTICKENGDPMHPLGVAIESQGEHVSFQGITYHSASPRG